LERGGDMYLAKKKAVVWVGKKDRVYTPKETVAMLEKTNMQPYIIRDAETNQYKSVFNNNIDYTKLGKVISDNLPKVGLNVDEKGFTSYIQYQNTLQIYLDNRRGYH
jgi:hypothetical protein